MWTDRQRIRTEDPGAHADTRRAFQGGEGN